MKPAESRASISWGTCVCPHLCVCTHHACVCQGLEGGVSVPSLPSWSSPWDLHRGFSLTSAGVLACTNFCGVSVCPVCLLISAHLFSQNEAPGNWLMTTPFLPQVSAWPSAKTSKGILFGSPYKAPQDLPLISSSQIQKESSLSNPSQWTL